MDIFGQKDRKSKENIYRREHVERGQKILKGAQRRYKFIQRLLEGKQSLSPGAVSEDNVAAAARAKSESKVMIEGLEALKQAHGIARGLSIDASIEEHLNHVQDTLDKAQGWYDQLKQYEEQAERRKQQEAQRKHDEAERIREIKEQQEQDDLRKRRARNERAELLTQEISNTALPEVSEKPREPKEPGTARGQKRRAADALEGGDGDRSVFPRNDESAPAEPEAVEPAHDEGELMAELFGDDEE